MSDNPFVVESKSFSDIAIEEFKKPAHAKLQEMVELPSSDLERLASLLPSEFFGCIFVGHKATDLDSIASAVGCAELFHGIAARASNVNSESDFALKYWEIDMPKPFLEVLTPNSKVCIVDHNQVKQCPDGINFQQLVGCIDHHAMQNNTISTTTPIYIDIKPWGSACTIVAHMFFRAKRQITRRVAGMLLSGILSDTLNLRSPTTTEHDKLAVALLAQLADIDNPNELARALFKAKSQEILRCTPHQLVRGDLKTFECRCPNGQIISIAFGVVETTDLSGLRSMRDDLALELRALKQEEKKDMVFLAFVDIINLSSDLLLVGSREKHLAEAAFHGDIDPHTNLMSLNGLVSRKKDFVPPLTKIIASGYVMPELSPEEVQLEKTETFGVVALSCGDNGCQTIRMPTSTDIAQRFVSSFRDPSNPSLSASSSCTNLKTVFDDNDEKCYFHEEKEIPSVQIPEVLKNSSLKQKRIIETNSKDSDSPLSSATNPRVKQLRTVHSFPNLDEASNLELQRSVSEAVRDPSFVPIVECAVRDLVDTVDLENVKHLISPTFTLPTPDEYKATLDKIAQGDDKSLKFLVMAVAHSFERIQEEPNNTL